MFYQYLFIAALVAPLQAGIFDFHKCSTIPALTDFDLQKFSGVWYDYAKNSMLLESTFVKCNKFNYIKNGNNYSLSGINTFYFNGFKVEEPVTLEEDAPNAKNGILKQKFGNLFGSLSSFKVISVKYPSYAIIYDCSKSLFSTQEKLQILTRAKTPSNDVVKAIYNDLGRLKINAVNELRFNDQLNCPNENEMESNSKNLLHAKSTVSKQSQSTQSTPKV